MGMSLATDPAVLILDEPTAGMSREETGYIVELIRQVTEGRTLLVVEHDMSVVFTLCDRVSVLVYGVIIASGEPATVRADKKVQEAYLGEEVH
jgi:branched-chain amino acid transport system ATP-binding protein